MAERAQLGVTFPDAKSWTLDATDRKILAEELEARADTLDTIIRTGSLHQFPNRYPGGHEEVGKRVRVLRREAKRLRGQA